MLIKSPESVRIPGFLRGAPLQSKMDKSIFDSSPTSGGAISEN